MKWEASFSLNVLSFHQTSQKKLEKEGFSDTESIIDEPLQFIFSSLINTHLYALQ
jgi:hypothetical protein